MGKILVSVVIPLYNCERYIARAVDSILDQTYKDIELIIINDGSTDSSLQIVETFQDKRINIISKQNSGLSNARNSGITAARGELIGFLDADDYWHPYKIEAHIKHFQAYPDVGLSYSYSQFCDEDNNLRQLYQISPIHSIQASDIFFKNPIGNGSTFMVRRQLAIDISNLRDSESTDILLFNPLLNQSEDIECWLRITLDTNWKIEGIPFILTYFRVHSLGLSSKLFDQLISWDTTVNLIADQHPEFIKNNYSKAKSYYLRFLARRAYSNRRKGTSFKFFVRSLRQYPLIIIEDPMRTALTLLAILLAFFLPVKLLSLSEHLAMIATSMCQYLRIQSRQRTYQAKIFALDR